jgi:hypothetical protein
MRKKSYVCAAERTGLRHRALPCVLAALVLTLGCASSNARSEEAANAEVALTKSGTLRVALGSSPERVPVRGDNQIELSVTRVDTGDPVEALTLAMVPFMPVMGHGSPAVPSFSDEGGGDYRFDDVVLTMPGLWELRTTITGAETDSVTFSFDVN